MLPQKPFIIAGIVGFLALLGVGGWFLISSKKSAPATVSVFPTPTPKPPTAILKLYSTPAWIVVPDTSQRVDVTDGQEITAGTIVITGETGRAAIIYSNKTVTRLDFDTEIILKELTNDPQKVTVKLEKRRIWSRVAKLLGHESYQSETNTLVATVRGTSYGHGILPDGRNKITAREGAIESTCTEREQYATVSAGLKGFFDCANDKAVRPTTIDKSDEDEWFAFNEEEDKKD